MKTLTEQLACVQSELARRREAYPWQINERLISAEEANHELACMEAVCRTLAEWRRLKADPNFRVRLERERVAQLKSLMKILNKSWNRKRKAKRLRR